MHLPQPSGCHLLRVLQEDHLAPTNILQGRGGEVSITVELVVSVTIYLAGQALSGSCSNPSCHSQASFNRILTPTSCHLSFTSCPRDSLLTLRHKTLWVQSAPTCACWGPERGLSPCWQTCKHVGVTATFATRLDAVLLLLEWGMAFSVASGRARWSNQEVQESEG